MSVELIPSFSPTEEFSKIYSREYIESLVIDTEDEVFLMKDTGFETVRQIEMYLKLRGENPGFTNLEINQLFATRTDSDIRAYEREFLARQPVLINHLSSRVSGGEYQIFGTKYNQRLLDVISADERHGAIKNAIINLERKMLFAPSDTLFAIHSPSGWAKDGYDDLPDDQIYLFKLDENRNLSAITLRLSLSLSEHEAILNLPELDNYKERLVQASSAIYQKRGLEFTDYLEIIVKNAHRDIAWVDKDKNGKLIKTHRFADIKEKLTDLPGLLSVDNEVDVVAQKLYWYLRADIDFSDPKNIRNLIKTLGTAALDMQHVLEVKQGKTAKKDYVQLAKRASELGGCVATSKGPKTNAELIKMGYTEGSCKNCGKHALCGPCTKMCTKCEKLFGIF